MVTLDTNVVSALITGHEEVVARWKQARLAGAQVKLNAISYYEMRRGLVLPRFARKFAAFERLVSLQGLLLLDRPALDVAASIYQDLRSRGTLLEDADILIAAVALANGATLATRNLKHFSRIEGLKLESWEA
ncbi:type II toxin-antitoxin system VapC family toxin [Truepera radiovictrix]|jgi:tRNA(fMet)-specific endonuclease VapC|uniref:Ribonuclease VapC n=1 Tax=Truepera radiovictrix (strain DSM 17093 / CIP 108686 / LMG 22925 / RQ-24) TaxID=649638 RepID=D7CU73_TRURR|nr:type II toxin-antitoxin system VapC family toxin [Truepera radiovictrix]ADI13971.1 PilT protein domain protein [Truepera radiovictrix DSM 17093]WMT58866.1 type II toxin-antitoxin system VapC family toxin [Truepera radiovictrix]